MTIISDRFNPPGHDANSAFLSVDLPRNLATSLAGCRAVRQISFADLGAACRSLGARVIVACPLIWGCRDVLCVIAALREAGFLGTLLVATPPLPNPAMVEGEVRRAAKGLSLRFVTV